MVSELDALRDDNARLKGVVVTLQRKAVDSNANVVQLQVEGKRSRATIKSQDVQIAKLTAIIESNKSTITSQAAKIDKLSASTNTLSGNSVGSTSRSTSTKTPSVAMSSIKTESGREEEIKRLEGELQRHEKVAKRMDKILGLLRVENEKAVEDLETMKRKMMPCYKVGFWIRQRNREEDWVRRGGKSSWFPASIICDCSTHYADPLSDASILCFTDDLEDLDSNGTERWSHYEQQYCVPPNFVIENHGFSKFLDILKGYANMQRYADEGSTSADDAAKFLKSSKMLIGKIYSSGTFKTDEDIERDVIADTLYENLQDIFGAAAIRHRTFVKGSIELMG
ncbi:hypothetical protein DL98DRAFT_655834, partial [Cadophora sp. DSE1049]